MNKKIIMPDDPEANLPQLVDELRELMATNTTLPPNHRTDFEFLAIFIRVRGYDVQRAYISVQKIFKYMKRNLKVFNGVGPPKDVVPLGFENQSPWNPIVCALKGRDASGALIAVVQMGAWDPDKCPFLTLRAGGAFVGQEAMTRKENQIHGVQFILNFGGFSLRQLKALSWDGIKCSLEALQGGFPVRVVGYHIINHPSLFWALYSMAYRLLSKKLKERMHFHYSMESLHERFSPEILPLELGGILTMETAMDQELINDILDKNESFEKHYYKEEVH